MTRQAPSSSGFDARLICVLAQMALRILEDEAEKPEYENLVSRLARPIANPGSGDNDAATNQQGLAERRKRHCPGMEG